jgi:hypothetical protein
LRQALLRSSLQTLIVARGADMARGRNDDTGDDQKAVHSKAIRGFA